MDYKTFIDSKSRISESYGFEVPAENLHPRLFDFQRDIVRWVLAKGRAAIFADCGLGKTLMQLSWASEVAQHEGKPVLILAPLAVSAQTVAEGQRFGIPVHLCEKAEDVMPGINITNYEKLDRFDTSVFAGIGSVPIVALQMGRRTMGFELKESYFKQAVLNCQKEENHDDSNI